MNQAEIEKVLRVLKKERDYMITLRRSAEPSEKAEFKGQELGINYAIKTIENGLRKQ